ncbi:MAG: glycosyltransferase family 4 protein [Actinomycetes bacterium]
MSTADTPTSGSGGTATTPRVLFSADIFTRQRSGGISRYHAELFHGLSDQGVDARIVLGPGGHPYFGRPVAGVASVPGVVPGRWAVKAGEIWTRLEMLRRAATVFHPTYYTARPVGRAPSVITIHDLIHLKGLSNDPEKATVVEGQRFWAQRADTVIAVSESTANDVMELLGVARSKIRVVHLGVRADVVPEPIARCAEPTLVFVGHRGGYKNWAACVQALARPDLHEWRLVCIGGGSPSRDERDMLIAEGVLDRVRFVGPSDDRELDGWLRSATALIYPSTYEGFGLPPLEAMVRGTPVVAANRASIPEVCGDAAILVDPEPDGLADGIGRLTDQSLRAELGVRGIERARQFSWESTSTRTREIYDELA